MPHLDDEWEDVAAGDWEDVGAPSTSSVDTLLSMPRGQGPTVDDEDTASARIGLSDFDNTERPGIAAENKASPLWALANPALGGLSPELARGQVKGLGQGAVNLGRLGAGLFGQELEMPEALDTSAASFPERLGAFSGRVSPSFVVPGTGWASAIGSGALGGAMESGTAEGAIRGAAGGALVKGAAPYLMKAPALLGRATSAAAPAVARVFENPTVQSVLDTATLVGVPLAGKAAAVGRFVSKLAKRTPKNVISSVDEARAALMAKEAAEADAAMLPAYLENKARMRAPEEVLGASMARDAEAADSAFDAARIADRQRGLRLADEETKAIAERAIAQRAQLAEAKAVGESRATEMGAGEYVNPFLEVEGQIARRFPVRPPTKPSDYEMALGSRLAKDAEEADKAFGAARLADRQRGLKLADEETRRIADSRIAQYRRADEKTKSVAEAAIARKKAEAAARKTGESRAADFDEAVALAKQEAEQGLKMAAPTGATSPQERGAIIRELAGGGKSKAERGAALSDATNKALDPEDATEAAAFLKEAGSLEEALRIIREAPGNTVQDVIHLTRAVREASRRGGK